MTSTPRPRVSPGAKTPGKHELSLLFCGSNDGGSRHPATLLPEAPACVVPPAAVLPPRLVLRRGSCARVRGSDVKEVFFSARQEG